MGSHPVERVKLQRVRRILAFENEDRSLRLEFIVGKLEVVAVAIEFIECVSQLLLARSAVHVPIHAPALESATPTAGVAIEALSCGVSLNVEVVERLVLFSQWWPIAEQ
ncbi:hypothetical protein [Gordonia sputi]|uniref:hypothetical protein n=1 Tax=Gordonia sputi TaxID=36823 RepID=UPI0028AC2F19|nr:hypothetical protein [Gordonia sputi]